MKPKAISFTPEVLKAKLRALEECGRCMTRRPIRPQPVEVDADGGGRIWRLETKNGFINSNTDGTWPRQLTRGVRDHDGNYYPPVAPMGAGQKLWIRERARVLAYDGLGRGRVRLRYEVDGAESDWIEVPDRIVTCEPGRCIANGVFREGARHFLEVVKVRAERVADISEQDALLEGIDRQSGEWAIASYLALYDSIYGAGAHARDWCWVYTLKRAAT